ncbi:MAG: class I SAM-dependent RNA methyltransferase [Chloroflexota bacterium]|nr:MAG: class I SAM-dependent RNA methyltransferase [Chloroflexota bacterium]
MAQGGEALAREENGRVIFVPYAIAGETARVEIVESHRGFARGRVIEILEASPHRITPRCPHFPIVGRGEALTAAEVANPTTVNVNASPLRACGGCQWQHVAYIAQLKFKTQIVRDQFARIAKMPDAPILDTIPARSEWFYRNNMQFVVNENGELCLLAPDSHTRVPIRECFIADEPIREMFKTLELYPESFDGVTLRAGEHTGDKFIILESDDPETPEIETDEAVSIAFRSGDVTVPILGNEFLTEKIGARVFRISPDSFFQVNSAMAQTLVELVSEYLEPRAGDILLDAYGGVGLFGLSLANQVSRVIEIEENPFALTDAKANAEDLNNVEFRPGRVENILPTLDVRIDIAVVDPPRAGLERAALDALAAKKPRAIAYVSCDTATLARDVARFVEHGYRLERVQPVDLFPQTHHIECVARLVLM